MGWLILMTLLSVILYPFTVRSLVVVVYILAFCNLLLFSDLYVMITVMGCGFLHGFHHFASNTRQFELCFLTYISANMWQITDSWQINSCQDSPCGCDLQNSLILLPPSSSLSAQTGLWFSAIYFRITEECVPRVSFWTHLYLHHVVVMKVLWASTIQTNLFLKCQAHIQDAIYWLIIKACTGTDQGLSMTAVIKQPTHIRVGLHSL